MLDRISANLGRKTFDLATRDIRSTPPIDRQPGDIRFVSLVCHRDLNRYLIAIKSVYRQIGRGDQAHRVAIDIAAQGIEIKNRNRRAAIERIGHEQFL